MHSVKSFCQGLNDRDASRVLKVFLSSTFRDFQKERNYLWTYGMFYNNLSFFGSITTKFTTR